MTISDDVNQMMDDYWKWLKDSTVLRVIDNSIVSITTPFLDRHNDNYQIYVLKKIDGYELTDDGYVISDLIMSGCDVSSGKRKVLLDQLITSFGLEMEGNVMKTKCKESDFASKKHDLIQAMMAVDDLYFTSKTNVISLFLESVSEWLMESKIPCTRGMNIRGKVYNHQINFALPDKELYGPKRILQVMDKPGKDKVANLLLMKTDVQEEMDIYVLINDTDVGDKNLEQVKSTTIEIGMKPILWSQRQDYIDELS